MPAGTYSRIYIQIVFAVKRRQSLISPKWDNDLYKYITGIIQRKGQLLIAINGVSDHIHILIGMKPTCCLSDLVREIKKLQTSGSMKKDSQNPNLNGRKVTAPFLTATTPSTMLSPTSTTKKNTIERKHFRKNTWSFWKTTRSNTRMNTFLNGSTPKHLTLNQYAHTNNHNTHT